MSVGTEVAAGDWAALRGEYIALRHSGEGPVAGWIGGDPELPEGLAWPLDGFGGPKEHLLSLKLDALPRVGLDLPEAGRLVFFLDAEYEEPTVLYFAASEALRPRVAPEEGRVGARTDLVAVAEPCWPRGDHPFLDRFPKGHFDGVPRWEDEPEPLYAADHRVGGYVAEGVQYDFPCTPWSRLPEGADVASRELSVLLAQLDYDPDAGLGWGDCGNAHWTISREDLAARRFDAVEFSWSCH